VLAFPNQFFLFSVLSLFYCIFHFFSLF
jgi:hypothetical protein